MQLAMPARRSGLAKTKIVIPAGMTNLFDWHLQYVPHDAAALSVAEGGVTRNNVIWLRWRRRISNVNP